MEPPVLDEQRHCGDGRVRAHRHLVLGDEESQMRHRLVGTAGDEDAFLAVSAGDRVHLSCGEIGRLQYHRGGIAAVDSV